MCVGVQIPAFSFTAAEQVSAAAPVLDKIGAAEKKKKNNPQKNIYGLRRRRY